MTKEAFTKPKPSPGKVVESFGETTSAHGVPKIIRAPSTISAFLWTTVTLVALGMFCYQGGTLVLHFFSWPYTTQLDVVTQPTLRFPAITVCNMNKLRRSELVGTIYEGLIELDGGVRDTHYDWWFDWSSAFYYDWRYSYFYSPHDPDIPNIPEFPSPNDNAPFPAYDPASLTTISNQLTGNVTALPTDYPSSEDYESSSSSTIRKRRGLRRLKRMIEDEKKRQPRQASYEGSSSYSLDLYDFYNTFSTWEASWRGTFNYYDYYDFGGVTDENDWRAFHDELLVSGEFNQWMEIVNPSRPEVERLGHQASDFILQCKFDKKKCNIR